MSVLLIAEHNNKELNFATLSTINAAEILSANINAIVIGYDCYQVVECIAKFNSISKVIYFDDIAYENFLVENSAELLRDFIQQNNYDYILAASTCFGKNLIPRLAALLDVDMAADITNIIAENIFEREIYAGNAIQTVQLNSHPKLITIRSTSFAEKIPLAENLNFNNISENLAKQKKIINTVNINTKFLERIITTNQRPDLTEAKIVVAGGRGLQNKENFSLIERLADKLQAAVGATGGAVNAEFVANELLIGQTGKIIAPDLYLAIGISGAIQHVAGIKDSKIIVAINIDENASIFQIANYGLVGDLFKILPELVESL